MMGLLIYKYEPLTRSQCKVSDTQVTVKACGPLVKIFFSRITWPFSTKLDTKHSKVKGIQVYSKKDPTLF